jgi:hypothetical protein
VAAWRWNDSLQFSEGMVDTAREWSEQGLVGLPTRQRLQRLGARQQERQQKRFRKGRRFAARIARLVLLVRPVQSVATEAVPLRLRNWILSKQLIDVGLRYWQCGPRHIGAGLTRGLVVRLRIQLKTLQPSISRDRLTRIAQHPRCQCDYAALYRTATSFH